MKYIVCKKFNKKGIDSTFNLKKGSTLTKMQDNYLYHNNLKVCYYDCDNAREYFAKNDDGKGLERHALCESIKDKIKEIVKEYNALYIADLEAHKDIEDYVPNIVDTVSVAYGKIRANYPTFIKGNEDLFTIAFYNAEPNQLEDILDRLQNN